MESLVNTSSKYNIPSIINIALITLFTMVSVIMIINESYYLIGIIIVLLCGIIGLIYRNIAILLFVISIFIPINYIERYFFEIPNIFRWLSYFLLLLAVFSVYIRYNDSITKFINWIPRYILYIALSWLFIGAISTIYNDNNIITMIMGNRWLFIMLFSFSLVTAVFRIYENVDVIKLLKWLVIIGLIMMPVTVLQRVVLVNMYKVGSHDLGDVVTGLFSSYPDMVFFQIFCIIVVISFWLKGEILISKYHGMIILILLLPLILSNARAAWIFLIICIIFILYLNGLFSKAKNLKIAMTFIFMITAGIITFDSIMIQYYPHRADTRISYIINPKYIIEYNFGMDNSELNMNVLFEDDGSLRRGQAVLFNYLLISENLVNTIIGYGPGSISHSRIPGGSGEIYKRFQNDSLDRNSFGKFLGELGISGILLVGILIFLLYNYKIYYYKGPLYLIQRGTVLLLLLLLIYYDVLQSFVVFLVLSIIINDKNSL